MFWRVITGAMVVDRKFYLVRWKYTAKQTLRLYQKWITPPSTFINDIMFLLYKRWWVEGFFFFLSFSQESHIMSGLVYSPIQGEDISLCNLNNTPFIHNSDWKIMCKAFTRKTLTCESHYATFFAV